MCGPTRNDPGFRFAPRHILRFVSLSLSVAEDPARGNLIAAVSSKQKLMVNFIIYRSKDYTFHRKLTTPTLKFDSQRSPGDQQEEEHVLVQHVQAGEHYQHYQGSL